MKKRLCEIPWKNYECSDEVRKAGSFFYENSEFILLDVCQSHQKLWWHTFFAKVSSTTLQWTIKQRITSIVAYSLSTAVSVFHSGSISQSLALVSSSSIGGQSFNDLGRSNGLLNVGCIVQNTPWGSCFSTILSVGRMDLMFCWCNILPENVLQGWVVENGWIRQNQVGPRIGLTLTILEWYMPCSP